MANIKTTHQHPEWFAFLDTEKVVSVGRHETFNDADDAAPPNTVWLFTEEALRSLQLSIETALDAPEER